MANLKPLNYALALVLVVLLNEAVALRNATHPRVRSFHCINGNYIFTSWFCDGINDCGDASDESYGCDQGKCGIGNFTCENSQCLHISARCNKVKECEDGSDEKFCDHEPNFDDCKISKGKYLCKDKLRCIDIGKVCDEEVHCFDSSDEGRKCDDYDHEICNVCVHPCFRTPEGPHCFYNLTTEEYEEIYHEIGSCPASKNYCDQKCLSFHDTTQCSCEENFNPSYTLFQSFYCEEKEKNKNMLVYTVKGAIRGIPGYSNQSVLIMDMKNENITAISAANEYVYWGGLYSGYKAIGKTPFNGDQKNAAVFVSEGIDDVTAMDVDWRTGNVYFIDNVRKRIAACTKDGKRCLEIHKLEQESTSITLAPRLGHMFFAVRDEEKGFIIRKSELNGANIHIFIDEGLGNVSCLSADESSEKLYWLDATRRKIEMVRFDGSGRKVFKSDLRMNYLSVTVNARYLYWIIQNNGTIFYTSGTRIQPKIALNGTDPVLLIYGYSHSEKTTKMEPPCSWGCNGICLINSHYYNKTGSDCVCSNATEVDDKGLWCRENADSIFSYHYEYDDRYYPREKPNRSFRTIAAIGSFVIIISGVAFYLHRKGLFDNIAMFGHTRMQ